MWSDAARRMPTLDVNGAGCQHISMESGTRADVKQTAPRGLTVGTGAHS